MSIYPQKVRRNFYVHRLVCEAFNGPPGESQEVMHMDGNKQNNTEKNLQWGTRRENIIANGALGVLPIGESHGCARLSEEDVLAIRADPRGYKLLGKAYDMTPAAIYRIKKRLTWKHI